MNPNVRPQRQRRRVRNLADRHVPGRRGLRRRRPARLQRPLAPLVPPGGDTDALCAARRDPIWHRLPDRVWSHPLPPRQRTPARRRGRAIRLFAAVAAALPEVPGAVAAGVDQAAGRGSPGKRAGDRRGGAGRPLTGLKARALNSYDESRARTLRILLIAIATTLLAACSSPTAPTPAASP